MRSSRAAVLRRLAASTARPRSSECELGPGAAGRRAGSRRPGSRAASQRDGFKPARSAVSRRKPIAEPQQVQDDGLRSARDKYRTLTPNGSCVAFATPPRAADRPLQTRHPPSCSWTPTRLAPRACARQRPASIVPRSGRRATRISTSTSARTMLDQRPEPRDSGSSAGPVVQQRGCLRRRRAANEHVHRSLRACTDPVFEWALPRACWQPSPPAA